MLVNAVNSQNFNGNFYYNHLLEKSIKNANVYELKRFSEALSRMKQSGDNRSLVLKERFSYLNDITIAKLALKDNNRNYEETVSMDRFQFGYMEQNNSRRFIGALEKINNILDVMYPTDKHCEETRETLFKKIRDLLI